MKKTAACLLALCSLARPAGAAAAGDFEADLYKSRFEHEIAFRAAALQVAWAAEPLCESTTEIEPFVLWSTHTMRKRPSDKDLGWLKRATGMDDKWRVAWLDESAPDELNVGDAVVAVNGRPLPGGTTKVELGAVFSSRAVVSQDDDAYWQVVQKARDEAVEGKPMTLTLEGGKVLKVETQAGCAGSVVASAFDADPDAFWRQGSTRSKIPANAMLEAKTRDEFRWLAAFGTYFLASERAIGAGQRTESQSSAFTVGKILTAVIPGSGVLLTALEEQTSRALAVDSIVGSADLFANEVVAAMGGDPAAGLGLSERMAALNMKVDTVLMDPFRRSNAAEHARRLAELRAARESAEAATDAAR